MDTEAKREAMWTAVLTGRHPGLRRGRRVLRLIPSDPRCKLCYLPFAGVGGVLSRIVGRRPSASSPQLCNFCENFARRHRGGAEIELTMLFADVRDSTRLAESLRAGEFHALMKRFYAAATRALIEAGAVIDKFVGDEVVSLFVPGFAGPDHANAATAAARELMRAVGYGSTGGPFLPVGVGIHTGIAYVGIVGGADDTAADFSALGDSVNVAARLASIAAGGEIVVSDEAFAAARESDTSAPRRVVELRGRGAPVGVRILHAA